MLAISNQKTGQKKTIKWEAVCSKYPRRYKIYVVLKSKTLEEAENIRINLYINRHVIQTDLPADITSADIYLYETTGKDLKEFTQILEKYVQTKNEKHVPESLEEPSTSSASKIYNVPENANATSSSRLPPFACTISSPNTSVQPSERDAKDEAVFVSTPDTGRSNAVHDNLTKKITKLVFLSGDKSISPILPLSLKRSEEREEDQNKSIDMDSDALQSHKSVSATRENVVESGLIISKSLVDWDCSPVNCSDQSKTISMDSDALQSHKSVSAIRSANVVESDISKSLPHPNLEDRDYIPTCSDQSKIPSVSLADIAKDDSKELLDTYANQVAGMIEDASNLFIDLTSQEKDQQNLRNIWARQIQNGETIADDAIHLLVVKCLPHALQNIVRVCVPGILNMIMAAFEHKDPSSAIRRNLRNVDFCIMCDVIDNHFYTVILKADPMTRQCIGCVVLDSYRSYRPRTANNIFEAVRYSEASSHIFKYPQVPQQQRTSNDCGLYAVEYVRNLTVKKLELLFVGEGVYHFTDEQVQERKLEYFNMLSQYDAAQHDAAHEEITDRLEGRDRERRGERERERESEREKKKKKKKKKMERGSRSDEEKRNLNVRNVRRRIQTGQT